MNTPLKVKIEGTNQLNQIIIETIKKIIPVFNNDVNGKIVKTDGAIIKKYKHLEKLLPVNKKGHIISFFTVEYNRLVIYFKICLTGGGYDDNSHYCEYFSKHISFCDLSNDGKIIKTYEISDIIKDYNLEKIYDLKTELTLHKEYEKQLEILKKYSDKLSHITKDHFNIRSYY